MTLCLECSQAAFPHSHPSLPSFSFCTRRAQFNSLPTIWTPGTGYSVHIRTIDKDLDWTRLDQPSYKPLPLTFCWLIQSSPIQILFMPVSKCPYKDLFLFFFALSCFCSRRIWWTLPGNNFLFMNIHIYCKTHTFVRSLLLAATWTKPMPSREGAAYSGKRR